MKNLWKETLLVGVPLLGLAAFYGVWNFYNSHTFYRVPLDRASKSLPTSKPADRLHLNVRLRYYGKRPAWWGKRDINVLAKDVLIQTSDGKQLLTRYADSHQFPRKPELAPLKLLLQNGGYVKDKEYLISMAVWVPKDTRLRHSVVKSSLVVVEGFKYRDLRTSQPYKKILEQIQMEHQIEPECVDYDKSRILDSSAC